MNLGCDYYAASLHKWLLAPVGTGLLYVRRDKIAKIWPLMAAAPLKDNDIRKFEEIGTHPRRESQRHRRRFGVPPGDRTERKHARFLYLRDLWPIASAPRLRGSSSSRRTSRATPAPSACCMSTASTTRS